MKSNVDQILEHTLLITNNSEKFDAITMVYYYAFSILSNAVSALVERVDPENVSVGHAVGLADGNGGIRDGSHGFRVWSNSKGGPVQLDNCNEQKNGLEFFFSVENSYI